MAFLERTHSHFALAHQRLDQVGADLVVLVHAHPAEHRQPAFVQRDLPGRQVARVLAEAVADVADRTHPKPDQVAVGMGGVTHEIAMQSATRLRHCQLVVGQGEMVHADVDIAGGSELFHRGLQQGQLGVRVGQQRIVDLLLRLEDMRQVRVAVDREAIRAHRHDGIEGAAEAVEALPGQAVDQVDVD